LYDAGDDGYVSIEVDPFLCDDAQATIKEGKRLFKTIDRKNVMIKVPATQAGYEAMSELTACAIPVNATLVFSKKQAVSCAKAFEIGLSKADEKVDTVISVFVSRIDRALDNKLVENDIAVALSGIYNSADIYQEIQNMGVQKCRVLFASTGVKDDSLAKDYYIEKLLAYNSVNTAPIDTIKAFYENKTNDAALPIPQNIMKEHFEKIQSAGINFDEVIEKQIADGLDAFKDAFKDILESL
jgi:transaldolase